MLDLDAWHPESDLGESLRGRGISYLRCEQNGTRYIAPLGSPSPPDVTVETVHPEERATGPFRRPSSWR